MTAQAELFTPAAVAFKGNFGLHRGVVAMLSNGRPGVTSPGIVGFPLHDSWRPSAEIADPKQERPKAYTLDTLAGIVGDSIGFVAEDTQRRVLELINRLRESIAAGNIDPDGANSNQAPEKSLISSLQGYLCRYANASAALSKGYKRGDPARVQADRAQIEEAIAEAEQFLTEVEEYEALISRQQTKNHKPV